jgi:class 3 adenylate cyclase
MLTKDQLPQSFRTIIDEQISLYDGGRSVTIRNTIPVSDDIPLDNQKYWLRIPDVICVFVDMLGSTRLSAENQDRNVAGAYQLYTGTAVRLFHEFEAPYIDVRGDGAFALFNSNQPYRALAAAITFKTFASLVFVPKIKETTETDVGSHIGIDQKTVLVRRIGLRNRGGRSDRQNEVWAGKPVNMSSKLASITNDDELLVSDRYFKNIRDEHALKTCGCPNGTKVDLWTEKDLSEDKRFDFDKGFILGSKWCSTHGNEYCNIILGLDK